MVLRKFLGLCGDRLGCREWGKLWLCLGPTKGRVWVIWIGIWGCKSLGLIMRVNSATVEEHLKVNLKELELNHWFKNERKTQHWIIDSKTKGKPNILTWIGASEAEDCEDLIPQAEDSRYTVQWSHHHGEINPPQWGKLEINVFNIWTNKNISSLKEELDWSIGLTWTSAPGAAIKPS